MGFWALELAKAFDRSLQCRKCKMSYFADDRKDCPYCGAPRPALIRARTPRWQVLLPGVATEVTLPHRLFYPFSFEHNDDVECEAVLNFEAKTAFPVRGTKTFPDNLTFEFVEAEK
jgi:ribosomal protein L37E